MKRWLYGLVLSLLMVPVGAGAHGGYEHVMSLDSQVSVSRQNVVEITETIVYDFHKESKHGIYRTIPRRYEAPEGKKYQLDVEFEGASMDGAMVPFETDRSGSQASVRLGDPDKTITGIHTYKLRYRLTPVVVQANGKDLLTLDLVGTGWEVPIEQAKVTLSLEGGARFSDAYCFVGSEGSTQQGCQLLPGEALTYSIGRLEIGEGLTVAANLPSGFVSTYLEPVKPSWKDWIVPGLLVLVALAVLGVVWIFTARWWVGRSRRKSQTVIAQYEPPKGMTPAEVGLLQDDVAAMQEVTAILIDLAIRGHIKIIQTRPKRWYRAAEYRLERLKTSNKLADFEDTLLASLFKKNPTEVLLHKVDRTAVAKAIEEVKSALKKRLEHQGLYGKSADQRGLVDKAVDSGTITDKGAKLWAEVEGFKLYLSVVEKDRLNFTDAPAKTPERFNKLLPYAVALGVEKQWAKQFEGIDVTPQTGWYSGHYAAWSAVALTNDLSSGFGGSVSSSFVSPSGGSSGGSAGGGFGGGGGGSW